MASITPESSNEDIVIKLVVIGVVVITVGAIIYIGRLLYKRRKRKRKDLEKVLEQTVELEEIDIKPSPKKTAADHLEELKGVTQKVLQPLRKSSTFSSPKDNSLNISNLSSVRSSSSSSRTKLYDKIPFNFKLFKVPPPPPSTPLSTDDIKVDPIRMSLLNLLLNNESENTSLMSSLAINPDLSRGTSIDSLPKTISRSQPNLKLFTETNSEKDLFRKSSHPDLNLMNSKKDLSRKVSHPDLNLTNSKKDLSQKISHPDLNLTNSKEDLSRKISHPDLNLMNSNEDLSRKISHPDLNLMNSKKDLSRKVSHPDLNLTNSKKDLSRKVSHPALNLTNSKEDLSRKISHPDLNLMNSKKDLSQKISHPDLILMNSRSLPRKRSDLTDSKKGLYQKMSKSQSDLAMSHLDLTYSQSKKDLPPQLDSSKISNDLTFASRKVPKVPTVPQLDSTIPSETSLEMEITQTRPKSISKVRSRKSHRRKHSRSRMKETNDYTNFQPIQNIKPIQNAQSEKRTMAAKITENEVGELTLSPINSVKPILKESQDDEIILDATLE